MVQLNVVFGRPSITALRGGRFDRLLPLAGRSGTRGCTFWTAFCSLYRRGEGGGCTYLGGGVGGGVWARVGRGLRGAIWLVRGRRRSGLLRTRLVLRAAGCTAAGILRAGVWTGCWTFSGARMRRLSCAAFALSLARSRQFCCAILGWHRLR